MASTNCKRRECFPNPNFLKKLKGTPNKLFKDECRFFKKYPIRKEKVYEVLDKYNVTFQEFKRRYIEYKKNRKIARQNENSVPQRKRAAENENSVPQKKTTAENEQQIGAEAEDMNKDIERERDVKKLADSYLSQEVNVIFMSADSSEHIAASILEKKKILR